MQKEPGDDPKRMAYRRRLPIFDLPRATSRKMRIVGWTAIPVFAVLAFVIAGGLPYVSSRFEHIEGAVCIPPRDIPWRLQAVAIWCKTFKRDGRAQAYTRVAELEFGRARIARAFELYQRGADLGDPIAHVQIGMMLVQTGFGQVQGDRARGIAALETAFKLGYRDAGPILRDVYSGRIGRGPREPGKAAMWAHANGLLGDGNTDEARDYALRLGLSEAEIDAAREAMRRWLEANDIRVK